jgi:tRNA threonylcarbamoyl adenosine modification protein YeaZ
MTELVLGIDTTGRGGAVAIATEEGILAVEVHDPELGYAEELFGLFDRVLDRCGRRRDELTAVAVLAGPGSFTGLRIGVMTAKTVAFSLDIPLFSAPTLELVAAASGPGHKLALAEAGGGYVWAQEIEVGEDEVNARGDIRRIRLAELGSDSPAAVCAPPLTHGVQVSDLAGPLAMRAALHRAPLREADPGSLVPEYASISQAERMHGLDLSEELQRSIEPQSWES